MTTREFSALPQLPAHAFLFLLPFPGAGVREDVFLIWREMEEAYSTLAQIQRLVAESSKSGVPTTDHGGCYLWSPL